MGDTRGSRSLQLWVGWLPGPDWSKHAVESASVEVVWIRRVTFESEVTNEVGLRFTDLTDFDRSRIAALLASRGTPR